MSVGENIARLCKELGVNGQELAKLTKMKASTIYDVMKEGSNPSASTLKKIIIALGVSADMVLFDDDDETQNTDLKILFREVEKFTGEEREHLKQTLRSIILYNRSKMLYGDDKNYDEKSEKSS